MEAYLRKCLTKYKHSENIMRQILYVNDKYQDLRPQLDHFVSNNGIQEELMCLKGCIPATYKGSSYNIPIQIWLMDTYPLTPPMVFVKPTSEMVIKPSRHIDHSGRIYLQHPENDLFGLIQLLIVTFSQEPPVLTKSRVPIPPGPTEQQYSLVGAQAPLGSEELIPPHPYPFRPELYRGTIYPGTPPVPIPPSPTDRRSIGYSLVQEGAQAPPGRPHSYPFRPELHRGSMYPRMYTGNTLGINDISENAVNSEVSTEINTGRNIASSQEVVASEELICDEFPTNADQMTQGTCSYKAGLDILKVIRTYRDFILKLDFNQYKDGSRKDLVCLSGTIPVNNQARLCSIPVCLWLREKHPYTSPLAFVKATGAMKINPNRYVDDDGCIHHAYLTEWEHPKSSLSGLLEVLITVFGKDLPVV